MALFGRVNLLLRREGWRRARRKLNAIHWIDLVPIFHALHERPRLRLQSPKVWHWHLKESQLRIVRQDLPNLAPDIEKVFPVEAKDTGDRIARCFVFRGGEVAGDPWI